MCWSLIWYLDPRPWIQRKKFKWSTVVLCWQTVHNNTGSKECTHRFLGFLFTPTHDQSKDLLMDWPGVVVDSIQKPDSVSVQRHVIKRLAVYLVGVNQLAVPYKPLRRDVISCRNLPSLRSYESGRVSRGPLKSQDIFWSSIRVCFCFFFPKLFLSQVTTSTLRERERERAKVGIMKYI